MRQLMLVTLGVLVACRVPGPDGLRTAVVWPAAGSWLTEQTPRCGEVVGRVIFWPFGADTAATPLPNALVLIGDTSRADLTRRLSAGTAAATDEKGEFRLRLPDRGSSVLTIRTLDPEPVVVAIGGGRFRAAVVEVGVRSMVTHDPRYGTNVQASRGIMNCTP